MPKYARKKTMLVYGVGINDADYVIGSTIDAKQVRCPFYSVWKSMLSRCYSKKYQEIFPTYTKCSVSTEWLAFSNFKSWMAGQDWKGKSLDKDILIQNNKVYSPSTCIFVSSAINSLLINRGALRGSYPLGVNLCKSRGKYVAQCSVKSKKKHLGYFDTSKEAFEAYKEFKYKIIAEVANQQSEPLRTALLNYVIEG
jgi:hypothetical protein